MALSFESLLAYLSQAGIKYLLAPGQPTVAFGTQTPSGRQIFVHASLESDGALLQMRTFGYATCPLDSPHLLAVLKVLNEISFRMRLVKFTLDPTDGEVTAYADLPILDGTATATQVLVVVNFLLERLVENADRIDTAIRTGLDIASDDVIA